MLIAVSFVLTTPTTFPLTKDMNGAPDMPFIETPWKKMVLRNCRFPSGIEVCATTVPNKQKCGTGVGLVTTSKDALSGKADDGNWRTIFDIDLIS
jgi:hypothetical protein